MSARLCKDRRCFVGGSAGCVIEGDDQSALLRIWREKPDAVEPGEVGLAPEDPNRRSPLPTGQYIAAVCYATAVILLGWAP
jgi:hypothetical protein